LPSLPNIPTLDEQGLKGFDVKVWHGVYAPKGTPPDVVQKVRSALQAALKEPAIKTRLDESSIDIVSMDKVTAKSLKAQVDSELNKWGPLIRKSKITD
jgi:tripartite-type tricarboxylate transporter receptor subunit TctC